MKLAPEQFLKIDDLKFHNFPILNPMAGRFKLDAYFLFKNIQSLIISYDKFENIYLFEKLNAKTFMGLGFKNLTHIEFHYAHLSKIEKSSFSTFGTSLKSIAFKVKKNLNNFK